MQFFTSAGVAFHGMSRGLFLAAACLLLAGCLEEKPDWPPRLGQGYPDLQLIDHTGREFRLSELRGNVILVEPIGMECAACNALSGGHWSGGYNGKQPQANLDSLESYLPQYANGIDISNPDLRVVQLILYDFSNEQPTPRNAKLWAEHFGLDKYENVLVAVAKQDLRSSASFNMIPGLQLIDRDFVLQKDAAGRNPRHNMFTDLMPAIADLIWG